MIVFLLIISGEVVSTITENSLGENDVVYGRGFIVFAIYEVVFLITGIYMLLIKYLSSFGIYKDAY